MVFGQPPKIAGQVLVVGDMLRKDHKRNRDVGHGDGGDIFAVDGRQTLGSLQEGEVGDPLHILEEGEINDHQVFVAGLHTDQREAGGNRVAGDDTDDERNQTRHFLAENGADHDDEKGDQRADETDPAVGVHHKRGAVVFRKVQRIANRVARKRQTDDGNRGADDDRRHQLVDPCDACKFHDEGDHNVDKTGKDRTDDDACIARFRGHSAGKRGKHGAEEGEGRAEEHRAAELREEQINDGADACAKQRRRLAHAVADNGGHGDGGRKDGKQLLERENDQLAEFGFVFDSVDKIHDLVPPEFLNFIFERRSASRSYCFSIVTQAVSSNGGICTWIRSSREVGMFLPT